MEPVIWLNALSTVLRVAGSLLLLVVFAIRARGRARAIGVVGSVLLLVEVALFSLIMPLLLASLPIEAMQAVFSVVNVTGTVVVGIGVIMVAYAIVAAFRSTTRSADSIPR